MLNRTHITVLILLAVIVWGGTLMTLGIPVTWDYTKPFAITVSVLSVSTLVFEKWIWKWRVFRGWLVNQPDLHGTWKVNLKSEWINPATGQGVGPQHCIMVIRQT